jgi:EmrB/QacA subfamily drug resistance transporter
VNHPVSTPPNRILLVLFLGVLMGALDIAIVGPALPAIQADYGVSERAMAWVFTAYVLAALVATPLMAKLSDRFGRRPVYIANVLIFGLGSLWVALSPSLGLLVAGRAVQGLGAGGIFPVASAVIGDTFPPERRGRALGLIGAVFGIAFLIGPILGGVLLIFGWPWLFLINIPVAALVTVLAARVLPTTRAGTPRAFDWRGMVLLGAMLAALAYGVNQIDTSNLAASIASPAVWPYLVAALLLLPAFVVTECRAHDPVLRLSLFNSRQVALTSAFAAGAGLVESALVFVPALIVAAYNVSASTASFMLIPAVLAMTVGAPLAGRLLDSFGSRSVMLLAMSLLATGMLLLSFFSTVLSLLYTAGVLVGMGLSMVLGAPLRYIMLNEARPGERGAAQAVLTLFMSVGQLVGGAVVGAVAGSRGGGVPGYQAAYLVLAVVSLCLVPLTIGLKNRSEERAAAR